MGNLFNIFMASLILLTSSALAQPNIILILSDDAGYNEIGYTGNNDFLTPAIDSIAATGVRFTNAYVTQPVCGPSRAGLLTGLYQQRLGFEENPPRTMNAPEGLDPGTPTLASRLRALGYTTGAIGKWHLGSTQGWNTPNDLGFDEFFGLLGGSRTYWGGEVDEWSRIRRQQVDVEALWPFEGDASQYDPVNGRYVTDAFGEEAVAFINNHASGPNPFFLYLSFTAPHKPYEAKQADLEAFPDLQGYQQIRAAMTLAMDRAIGNVLEALDTHGIAQNTIVVFLNDNGGTPDRDNSPFMGHKGLTWEGGIRVPFCIRWPGMPEGVDFGRPVISMDLVPTLLAAAGGVPDPTDGVDLAPFILGNQQGDPHEMIYIRDRWEWAIRRGQWKLVRPDNNSQTIYLFDLDSDPGETTNLSHLHPPLVDALHRELAVWESTLDKLRWTSAGTLVLNDFDHFRSRTPSSFFAWSNEQAWYREDSQDIVTLEQHDAYANAVLEFPTRGSDYAADNALGRMTGELFMCNAYRFTHSSGQGGPFEGTITGFDVLLVPNLAGDPPMILLESSVTPFSFRIEHDTEFLGTLTLSGDGTSPLTLAAPMTEYLPGQSVRKTGSARIDVADRLRCSGDIAIDQGVLAVRGGSASLDTDTAVRVEPAGTLHITDDGRVDAPLLFNAGTVKGEGLLRVEGDFRAADADSVLAIGLAGTEAGPGHDQLLVAGTATLGGRLALGLRSGYIPEFGQAFRIVQAVQRVGEFDALDPPPEQPHRVFELVYDAAGVTLIAMCSTDLDGSGVTDTFDFVLYLDAWATGDPVADWTGDGVINSLDVVQFINEWSTCRS